MNREYHKWYSWRLDREVELLVFGHAGAKVLVYPTRDGDYQEYEQIRMSEALRWKIEMGHIQLFCLDYRANETFYCWWAEPQGRLYRHWQFEEYVLNEVFPFMSSRNQHNCVIAHGCSFGAFLAANIALRHPHLFNKLVAFSGRYDLTESVESFGNLLDGYYDDAVYFNMPTHFLRNLECPYKLHDIRKMDIILVIGNEDPFVGNNQHLSSILHSKSIPHQLHFWDSRAHSGYYWRRMASLYI